MANMKDIVNTLAHTSHRFLTFNDQWNEQGALPESVSYVFGELLPRLFPSPSQFEIAGVPFHVV